MFPRRALWVMHIRHTHIRYRKLFTANTVRCDFFHAYRYPWVCIPVFIVLLVLLYFVRLNDNYSAFNTRTSCRADRVFFQIVSRYTVLSRVHMIVMYTYHTMYIVQYTRVNNVCITSKWHQPAAYKDAGARDLHAVLLSK